MLEPVGLYNRSVFVQVRLRYRSDHLGERKTIKEFMVAQGVKIT